MIIRASVHAPLRLIANLMIVCGLFGVAIFTATKVDAIVHNRLANSEFELTQLKAPIAVAPSGSRIPQGPDLRVPIIRKPTLQEPGRAPGGHSKGELLGGWKYQESTSPRW